MAVGQQYIGEEMCEMWDIVVRASRWERIELFLNSLGINDCRNMKEHEQPASIEPGGIAKRIAVPTRISEKVFEALIAKLGVISIHR